MVGAPVLAVFCRLVRLGLTGTDWIISSVVDHNLDTLAGPGRLWQPGRKLTKSSRDIQ